MTQIDRGKFTDYLLGLLHDTGELDNFGIGDGEAPVDAGWSGDANAPSSVFVPYVVLTPAAASRSQGTFADPQDTWQLPYVLAAVGVQRQQSDWIAQRALDAFEASKKQKVELGTARWKIIDVSAQILGAPQRQDSTEPPFWQRNDTVMFFVTKERV